MPFSIPSPALEIDSERAQWFTWRGLTRSDLADIWQLFQDANRADDGDHNETLRDLEREFHDPSFDPAIDARVIRNASDSLVAFARVLVPPVRKRENLALLEIEMDPDVRGHTLEEEILQWAERNAAPRLAQTGQTANEREAGVLRTSMPAIQRERIALYEEHGFRNVRTFNKMQRDLQDTIPDARLPGTLHPREYDPALDEKMCQAYNEAFDDHWGFSGITPSDWQTHVMGVTTVRRDLSLVVFEGDEIVAFCINCERAAENQRLGIRRGWTTKLGTRRAWRKRGIAGFLLAESMRRFLAEGFDYAGLGVDADNLTNALALYKGLGYQPYKTRFVLEKRLSVLK